METTLNPFLDVGGCRHWSQPSERAYMQIGHSVIYVFMNVSVDMEHFLQNKWIYLLKIETPSRDFFQTQINQSDEESSKEQTVYTEIKT